MSKIYSLNVASPYRMKRFGAGVFDSARSMPIGYASDRVPPVINGSSMKSSFALMENSDICIEQ
jgi:hypothetical protein